MVKKELEKKQWIDIFDGKRVKGANKKIQLNANETNNGMYLVPKVID